MTDELPPHLVNFGKYRPKPPRAEMETVQSGSAPFSSRGRDPDPLRPVPSDTTTRWLSLPQAAASIAAAIPDPKYAEQAILRAALDGALHLSCEVLTVKTLAGDPVFTIKRPSEEARLGERIDKAYKACPVSNFNYEPNLGRLSWVSLAGGVRHVAQRLLVDAEEVAALYAIPVLSAAKAEHVAPSDPSPSVAPIASDRKSARGRPKGTDSYPADADIVRRVIELCDNGHFQGAAQVRRAIQSLIGEIEPRTLGADGDPAKIRRIRGKVLRERDDLI